MRKFLSGICLAWLVLQPAYSADDDAPVSAPDVRTHGYLQGGYSSVQNDIDVTTDTFHIRRARAGVRIGLTDGLSGYLEGDLYDAVMTDAYVAYVPRRWIGLIGGQMKIPLGAEAGQRESELDFIEYAKVTEQLVVGVPGIRDIGVKLISAGPYWDAQMMLSNGSGPNRNDQDEGKAVSGRAVGIYRLVQAGGSYYRSVNTDPASGVRTKTLRWGGEFRLGDETGFLQGEYLFGKDGNIARDGFSITGDTALPIISPLVYKDLPLRVLIRFAQWDPDTHMEDDAESSVVFGLRYLISAYCDGTINYAVVQEEAEQQIDNNRLNAQIQLRF